MRLGLLWRELAAADELCHERVILGQLLELAVADQVGARVADVTDPHAVAVHERDRHRRAHARDGCVVGLALVDAPVCLLDQSVDPLPAVASAVARIVAERCRSEARGDLAGLRAADSVGHGEERRLADVGVLVEPAPAPGIRGGRASPESQSSYLNSVSPIRTMSPGV